MRTVFSGTESIKYLGSKIWELIPDEMKELESLWEFKRAIKLWKSTSCSCRLCKQTNFLRYTGTVYLTLPTLNK